MQALICWTEFSLTLNKITRLQICPAKESDNIQNAGIVDGYKFDSLVPLEKGNLVKTFRNWGGAYTIDFDISVFNTDLSFANVFHLTKGDNLESLGDRLPAIWVNRGNFSIVSDLNGTENIVKEFNINANQNYHVRISQLRNTDGDEVYQVAIDGTAIFSDDRGSAGSAGTFEQVKLYLSGPHHESAKDHVALANLQVVQYYHGNEMASDSVKGKQKICLHVVLLDG